MGHTGQCLLKGTCPPKGVVGNRVGTIEADAHPPNPGGFNLARHIGIDQRAVGRQGDDQSSVARVASDVEDVGAKEGFTAGQHKDGPREISNLGNQIERLPSREVLRQQLISHGDPSTVNAGQVAARRRLPKDETRWDIDVGIT